MTFWSLRTSSGRAVGDLGAVVEHHDVVGDGHDHRHVVLDQQDRGPVVLADQPSRVFSQQRLARVEARGRLVEAQQHRIGAHGADDLEPPLVAVGQIAGRIVGPVEQADAVEPEARPSRPPRAPWPCSRRCPSTPRNVMPEAIISGLCCATSRFSSTVMPVNRRMFWNVRATLALRAISWSGMRSSRNRSPWAPCAVARARLRQHHHVGRRRDPLAGQRHAALGRLVEARDAVEHGGLAGAVRADQRRDVAAPDREGQVVHGHEAAEPHGQVLDDEQRVGLPAHQP